MRCLSSGDRWPAWSHLGLAAAIDRPALPGVRRSVPEQWLVKLRPLGYVDGRVVAPLREALAAVHGLDELAGVVFEATQELVPVTHPQPFQADLVLARGRVPAELAGRPVTGSWTARSVALLADRSSPQAVRFQELASFPLEDLGPA
jgi:hypothetical protein